MQNPYRSMKAKEISLEKMGDPDFTNSSIRYPETKVVRGKIDGLEPILINYSEEDKKQNKRICLAALGSSHTEQHTETLRELALEYNVSLAILCSSSTILEFNTYNKK